MINPQQFGMYLQDLRKQAGLTQAGLAARLNNSVDVVRQWERGELLPPDTIITQLAHALEVPVLDIEARLHDTRWPVNTAPVSAPVQPQPVAAPATGLQRGLISQAVMFVLLLVCAVVPGIFWLTRSTNSDSSGEVIQAASASAPPSTAVAAATTNNVVDQAATPTVANPTASASPVPSAAPAQSRLALVRARNKLICGVPSNIPGFGEKTPASLPDEQATLANWSGFDVDQCKAVAAAIFGVANDDSLALRGVFDTRVIPGRDAPVTRFDAVLSGEVDVLFASTTWTSNRDTGLGPEPGKGLDFGPTTFYDGQGFLVPSARGWTNPEALQGLRICVHQESTSRLNITPYLNDRGVDVSTIVIDAKTTLDEVYSAYETGRCDAVVSDISQLVGRRSRFSDPAAHEILADEQGQPFILSKEPLAPVVQENDSQWRDIISWTMYAVMAAEEEGVTSTNIETFYRSETTNRAVRLLLGLPEAGATAPIGSNIGLQPDFARRVIATVGNYGEIYNRHFGPTTPLNLPRGPNGLWKEGGRLDPPPFR
jgi:general L-amino acid transport system substrate-binding protein